MTIGQGHSWNVTFLLANQSGNSYTEENVQTPVCIYLFESFVFLRDRYFSPGQVSNQVNLGSEWLHFRPQAAIRVEGVAIYEVARTCNLKYRMENILTLQL